MFSIILYLFIGFVCGVVAIANQDERTTETMFDRVAIKMLFVWLLGWWVLGIAFGIITFYKYVILEEGYNGEEADGTSE